MAQINIPLTCPAIDSAIDIIELTEINDYDKELILDCLEDLRKDNIRLREALNDLIFKYEGE